MYLVDTNVLSVGARPGQASHTKLLHWMDANATRLFLSVMSVTEIEDGIAKAKRVGASRKASDLADWLEALLHLHTGRILTFDVAIARIAGTMSDLARGLGHAPGMPDIIIAATARHHRLTILSRNIRHFQPLGIAAFDPFIALPPG